VCQPVIAEYQTLNCKSTKDLQFSKQKVQQKSLTCKINFKEIPAMDNVYNALTVLIIAGVFLIFALGILALTYAQKIRKSWEKD